MERGSNKHGPMVDDRLRRDTEGMERGSPVSSRVADERDPEGAADFEPETDSRLTLTAAEARSKIARHLDRVVFPAGQDELIANAERHHAPMEVLEALRQLPSDVEFENIQQIWLALGGEPDRGR